MNEEKVYYKDGVARVVDLLKDTFGDSFREYFNGDPAGIAESQLPAIIVSETEGTISSGASGTDNITENILIIVSLNKKDDFGAPNDTDLTEFKLRKLVKGQNVDGQYYPKTIMYALRKYISMNDAVLRSEIATDFNVNQRGENLYTQEAYISITIERLAIVPSRE